MNPTKPSAEASPFFTDPALEARDRMSLDERIADDNRWSRNLLIFLLAFMGHEVVCNIFDKEKGNQTVAVKPADEGLKVHGDPGIDKK